MRQFQMWKCMSKSKFSIFGKMENRYIFSLPPSFFTLQIEILVPSANLSAETLGVLVKISFLGHDGHKKRIFHKFMYKEYRTFKILEYWGS